MSSYLKNEALRRSAIILVVCLTVALVAAAPAQASVTALNTNQTIYQPGDLFVLTLLLSPGLLAPERGDLYVKVTLPDGSHFFLNQNAQLTATVRPFRPDLTIDKPSVTEIFSLRVPSDLPHGTYMLQAFQAKSGSDPINPDNRVGSGFPLSVAVGSPTSPTGANLTIPFDSVSLNNAIAVNPATSTAILARIPNSLSTVNLLTNRVVASIRLADLDFPIAVAVNPPTNVAVVLFFAIGDGSFGVALLDLNTNQVTATLPLSNAGGDTLEVKTPIVIDALSNRAIVSSRPQNDPLSTVFTTIDLGAKKITSSVVTKGLFLTHALGPSPNTLFADAPSHIAVIDLATGTVTTPFVIGFSPERIARLSDQNKLVIAGSGSAPGLMRVELLTILDVRAGQTTPPVELSGARSITDLALNPTTNQAVVLACQFDEPCLVFTIDLGALTASSFQIPGVTFSVAIDPNQKTILVPSGTFLAVVHTETVPMSPPLAPLTVSVHAAETGTPIAGATVAVQRTGLAKVTTSTSGDSPGTVSFFGVPVGPQTITVAAVGFAPATVPVTIQAGQTNAVTISLVRQATFGTLTGVIVSGIPPGSTGSVTAVTEARNRPAGQTSHAQSAGRGSAVTDQALPTCAPANATPISGATVALPSPGAPIEATTGADGTFFLAQAPAGTVLVAVRAPGQNPTTQLAPILQSLESCIVVTLLPTLNPDSPTIALALNAGTFRPGQTLTLDRTLSLSAGAAPTQADEYLLGVLPGGQTLLSLVAAPPGFAFGVLPFRANVAAVAATDRVFQFTFSGGEPPGTYQAVGRLVKPSGNPLNPADWLSTTTTSFTFAR